MKEEDTNTLRYFSQNKLHIFKKSFGLVHRILYLCKPKSGIL